MITYKKLAIRTCGLMLLLNIGFLYTANGQHTNIPYESSRIQLAYKNQPYLSFNVRYTYARDSFPTDILDTMDGVFKMSGTYYWGLLDSTEYMQNSSYAIALYKPDKIMHVANSSPVYPQLANFSSFDSLVGKNNYTTSFTTSGANRVITLTFTPTDFPYKTFKIKYDSTSNLVKQISYTIKDDFNDYADSYNRSAAGNTSEYVTITADFSNYSTASFSNTIFLTANYFVLSGSTYTPQTPFDDYYVYLSSPNLIK